MSQNHEARRGYEPILQRLLPLFPALMAAGDPGTLREGFRKVPHLAHGWYMRCHRSTQALLTLDGMGYAEEASPIRRSIIEHILALEWLAAEGDKLEDTIALGHAYKAQARADAASDAGWHSVDQEARP